MKFFRENFLGLSQLKLAKELGLTRGQISSYEENRASPTIEFLEFFSEKYELNMDALIKVKMDESNMHGFTDQGKTNKDLLEFEKKLEKEKEEFIALLKVVKSGLLKGQDLTITCERLMQIFLSKEVELSAVRKKLIDFYMSQDAIKKIVKQFTGKDIDLNDLS